MRIEGVRHLGRSLRRRATGSEEVAPSAGRAARLERVAGMVEEFSRGRVVGWVSVSPDREPLRVTLHVDDLEVGGTYATPGASISSAWQGPPGAESGSAAESRPAPYPHALPTPKGDRRNSRAEIRSFHLRVRGLWPYLTKGTRVSVRADGHPLPIHGHGMFVRVNRDGRFSPAELREKLQSGWVLSQKGTIQLSKKLDTEWQGRAMRAYDRVRTAFKERFDLDLWFVYGTLLGAVRDGTYIGHDVDVDVAFLSRRTSGPESAQEMQEIGLALVELGFVVDCRVTALHVTHPDDPDMRIDIFHTYFDGEGDDAEIAFPFGIAGTSSYTRADWQGLTEIDFPGGRGLVPVAAEKLVEHLYGADWRQPKPGFHWDRDRTRAALDGRMTVQLRNKVYWANFYAHTEYDKGSTFFEFVNSRPDVPQHVVDIGCGDGRDARAFASAGRTVLGLDQSEVGVEHATRQAVEAGLGEQVDFAVCDVADRDRFVELVGARLGAAEGPVLFYLRFFLHSVPADVQERLLDAITELARPGDLFAAEFRTDKDEANAKVHGKHWRRFQNAEEFSRTLRERHGFTVLHEEEGTGLSPYGEEDPVLYRVVAVR